MTHSDEIYADGWAYIVHYPFLKHGAVFFALDAGALDMLCGHTLFSPYLASYSCSALCGPLSVPHSLTPANCPSSVRFLSDFN